MSHLPPDTHRRLERTCADGAACRGFVPCPPGRCVKAGRADNRKPCTCDGDGRGPGRECVVKAGGRLGELWRCAKGLEPQPVLPSTWEGAEEWMPLAWQLCAEECGEDACNELVWQGGAVPEPWGDRWLKYEDEAKRLIALVRAHVPGLAAAPAPPAAPLQWQGLTDDERAQAVHAICEYGTGFVTPLFSVIDGIERALQDRNAARIPPAALLPAERACCGTFEGSEHRSTCEAERAPLTDEQILACVRSVGTPAPMGLTRDRGPYEVTEPTWFLTQLVRAIERAHGIDAAMAQRAEG